MNSTLWLNRFDFHVHTSFSDGKGSLREVLSSAQQKGIRTLAITDHWEVGRPNTVKADVNTYRAAVLKAKELAEAEGLRLLPGVETGVRNGVVLCPAEIMDYASIVIGSVHTLNLPQDVLQSLSEEEYWQRYKERVLETVSVSGIDVIGHIEGYLPARWNRWDGADFSRRRESEQEIARQFFTQEWYEELADMATKHQVAIEIHCLSRSPRVEVLQLLKEKGVKFSIGSDAHLLEHVGHTGYAQEIAEKIGLSLDDLLLLTK